MVNLEHVRSMALSLPEVVEGTKWGNRTWLVNDRGFVWERPISKADIKRHRPAPPPEGPIVAIAAEDLHDREAILAMKRPGFFTIPHFDGYPAYLIQLDLVDRDHLNEALVDAWLAAAPTDMATAYLNDLPLT